jgi:hypothetical protein
LVKLNLALFRRADLDDDETIDDTQEEDEPQVRLSTLLRKVYIGQ